MPRSLQIWVLYGDNGKENGNYYNGFILGYILVLYGDNGKENGNYYNGFILGYILVLYGLAFKVQGLGLWVYNTHGWFPHTATEATAAATTSQHTSHVSDQ